VAAALSAPPAPTSAEDQGPGEDRGTRPFEALEGWNEPYLDAPEDDGSHGDGHDDSGGVGRRSAGDTTAGAATGIGVPIEEVINNLLASIQGCGVFRVKAFARGKPAVLVPRVPGDT